MDRPSARERFTELGFSVVDGGQSAPAQPIETRAHPSFGPVLTPNVERLLERVLNQQQLAHPDR